MRCVCRHEGGVDYLVCVKRLGIPCSVEKPGVVSKESGTF